MEIYQRKGETSRIKYGLFILKSFLNDKDKS